MMDKLKMPAQFALSMHVWMKSGFKVLTEEEVAPRMEICKKCQSWDQKGYMGLGICKICGCSQAKLWLGHERCPVGKWEKIPVDEKPKDPVQ